MLKPMLRPKLMLKLRLKHLVLLQLHHLMAIFITLGLATVMLLFHLDLAIPLYMLLLLSLTLTWDREIMWKIIGNI